MAERKTNQAEDEELREQTKNRGSAGSRRKSAFAAEQTTGENDAEAKPKGALAPLATVTAATGVESGYARARGIKEKHAHTERLASRACIPDDDPA